MDLLQSGTGGMVFVGLPAVHTLFGAGGEQPVEMAKASGWRVGGDRLALEALMLRKG